MGSRTGLKSIQRHNLREDSHTVLRAAILSGELEPESIYSTSVLAGRLGVSPTPVREAMLELARQGLVESLPNRGFRIVSIRDRDLDEIRDLRLMLEVPALALVIERAADADLKALRPFVRKIGAAARDRKLQEFLTADREFHLRLFQLGRNGRLVRTVGELRDQTRVVGIAPMAASGALDSSEDEHAAILDAVLERDVATAQLRMIKHLHHTRGVWAGQTEDHDWDAIRRCYPWLSTIPVKASES